MALIPLHCIHLLYHGKFWSYLQKRFQKDNRIQHCKELGNKLNSLQTHVAFYCFDKHIFYMENTTVQTESFKYFSGRRNRIFLHTKRFEIFTIDICPPPFKCSSAINMSWSWLIKNWKMYRDKLIDYTRCRYPQPPPTLPLYKPWWWKNHLLICSILDKISDSESVICLAGWTLELVGCGEKAGRGAGL